MGKDRKYHLYHPSKSRLSNQYNSICARSQLPQCSTLDVKSSEYNKIELSLCKKKKQLYWPQLESSIPVISEQDIPSRNELSQLIIVSPRNGETIEIDSVTLVIRTMLHEMSGENTAVEFHGNRQAVNMTWLKDSSQTALIRAGMNPSWASEFSPYLTNTTKAGRLGTVSCACNFDIFFLQRC